MGGHDEREQTLNQILTEMDGFSGSEGVVVIAATNRADVLDPALTRPGRFDRIVQVQPAGPRGPGGDPARSTPGEIPLAEDVDLAQVARTTPGMTGADLANLANEAALLAVKRKKAEVDQADLSEALEKVQLGAERPLVMPEEERRRTAYHESGHALLGMLQPGADPVRKITIVPRGRALGVTLSTPDADRYAYTEEYLRGRIIGALGGMAAEQRRLRSRHHRLRERPRTGHQPRPRHGRALGHERKGRPPVAPSRAEAQQAYGLVGRARHARRRWTTRCGASSTSATSEAQRLLARAPGATGRAGGGAAANETLDEEAAYRAAGIARLTKHGEPSRGQGRGDALLRSARPGSAAFFRQWCDQVAEDVRHPDRAVPAPVRMQRLRRAPSRPGLVGRADRRVEQPGGQQPAHRAVHVRVPEGAGHPAGAVGRSPAARRDLLQVVPAR